jgi:4-diphosphocytidyl-2-C-methyl-D-erythritol kinase
VQVTVPSFAKLNLDLRVLDKRPDGFHEVRTVFQTISLKDSLSIEFDFAKRTQIDLLSSVEIADNLVVRAAKLVLEQIKVKAWVRFALDKQIPMGAGLGGGSSNAAAVLLALPALAGRPISLADQVRLGGMLGSDVPFFMFGGTALGLGRGTELYPLPDQPAHHVLVVSTGVHVSTPEAYRSLGRNVTDALTSPVESPMLREFQTVVWAMEPRSPGRASLEQLPLENDFEQVVFKLHPELAAVARKLRRLGAKPAMMTGSGSAIFGVFPSAEASHAAARHFPAARTSPVRFINRRQYRSRWLHALGSAAPASSFAR